MRHTIVKRLQLLLLLFVSQNIFGQEILTSLKSDIIAPDPASAVFRQYMSPQPVLSTGAINIPIPLYELNYKGIKIPFTLCYRTTGIQVYADPYPCGYGWVFMPGLRISRTIMGRPDERFKRMNYSDTWSGGELDGLSEFDFYKRCITPIDNLIADSDLYDTQHDIFTFNILSGSYTFVSDFTTDGVVKFIGVNDNNLKINASIDLSEIEVIDESGIKYEFEIGERLSCMDNYPTAWVLKTITLTNGETINFEWQSFAHKKAQGTEFTSTVIRDAFNPYRKDIFINGDKADEQIIFNDAADEGNMAPYGRNDRLAHLSKITYPGGTITLTYKPQSAFMSSFSVSNSHQENIKNIEFTYGEASDSCLLKAVKINDEGIYRFDYNPNRFCSKNAQDYWGFYNGKTENISLIPKMLFKNYTSSLASDTIEGSTLFLEHGKADRSVNEEMMQANILTTITYPTGGQSQIEYETHRFNGHDMLASSEINNGNTPRLTMGGGLRVKRIITSDGISSTPIIKRYEYGINNNGLANSVAEPTLETFIDVYDSFERSPNYMYGTFACFYRLIYLNSASKYMRNRIGETPIWYSQVTEYDNEGKTVYKFDHILDENKVSNAGIWREIPFVINRLFSKGPLLTERLEYKGTSSNYELIRSTKKEYNILTPHAGVSNNHIYRNIVAYGSCFPTAPDFEYNENENKVHGTCSSYNFIHLEGNYTFYSSSGFSIYFKTERLQKEIITDYINGDSIKTELNYNYYPNSCQLSKKTIRTGDGMTETTEYIYPTSKLLQSDIEQREILSQMLSKNIIGSPFRTITTKGEATTTIETRYKYYGNNLYLPYQELLKKGNDSIITRTCDYDRYGNIRGATFFNGKKETYLWGYGGQYPVFYIAGMNYDEVKGVVGENMLESIYNSNIEACRLSLATSLAGKAQIMTYQYKPLVGINYITDINENAYNYTYDNRNRLTQIQHYGHGIKQQFAYNMNNEMFTASISSGNEYILGDNIYANCTVDDTSGQVSYQWLLADSTGYNITPTNNKSSSISTKINHVGNINLSCVATDQLKQISVTATKTIYVHPETIKMSNMSGENTDCFTATISCCNPIEARFRVYPGIESGVCNIRIGNHTSQIQSGSQPQYIDVSLPAGNHVIEVAMSDDSSGEVIFALHNVSGTKSEKCEYKSVIIMRR